MRSFSGSIQHCAHLPLLLPRMSFVLFIKSKNWERGFSRGILHSKTVTGWSDQPETAGTHILTRTLCKITLNNLKRCSVGWMCMYVFLQQNLLCTSDKVARDVDRLERWVCVDVKNFKEAKCKVLHLVEGQGNPRHVHRLGGK